MILSTIPSSSATITVSLEVKSTAFQLGALIFHFLSCLLDFLLVKELDLDLDLGLHI